MESNAWWREHPAYNDLVQLFKDAHINNGTHLAYVLLTGLRYADWELRRSE